jgi:hypothetical protein
VFLPRGKICRMGDARERIKMLRQLLAVYEKLRDYLQSEILQLKERDRFLESENQDLILLYQKHLTQVDALAAELSLLVR